MVLPPRLARSAMPITPFLAGQAFDPEIVHAMSVAFDEVCRSLHLRNRSDPTSEIVAKKIIELAQRGIRHEDALAARALRELDMGG